jgi:hypothetical protein
MGQNHDLKKNGQMDETGTARCNSCFRFNQSTPMMPIQFHWGVIHLYVIEVCLFSSIQNFLYYEDSFEFLCQIISSCRVLRIECQKMGGCGFLLKSMGSLCQLGT